MVLKFASSSWKDVKLNEVSLFESRHNSVGCSTVNFHTARKMKEAMVRPLE